MITSGNGEHWGIVGGGLLGMTIAHRLAQQGRHVSLFEAAGQLGGLASTWQLGDVIWDRHYHVTLLSDLSLRALLAELGLETEMTWAETRTGFYTDGQLYSMSNIAEFLRFPPLTLIDKWRLALTILYASRLKEWKNLEDIPVTDWLKRWSGRHTLEKIWLPLLRAKLGENYKKASAAFIWACIARLYAARRSGLKREMFGYVRGGYARVLDSFATVLAAEGVGIHPGHVVNKVEARHGGDVTVEFQNGHAEVFDQVVLTIPAPIASRVCPSLTESEKAQLNGIQYQGIICASLLLKHPLANFYVTNITDSWVPFTAVIEMSALVDRQYFGNRALVYLPKYVAQDDPAWAWSDAEIEESFLAALTRMYSNFRREDVLCFQVSRVRQVLAISTLNYSAHLPPMTTSIPGVHIINSAHIVNGTLNVNETVHLAEHAVRHLLASPLPSVPVFTA